MLLTFNTDTDGRDEAIKLVQFLDNFYLNSNEQYPAEEIEPVEMPRVTPGPAVIPVQTETPGPVTQFAQETAAAASAEPPTGKLDTRGVAWHVDYHSSSQAKNADGTWRNKRGVNKTLLAQYEAQFAGNPPVIQENPAQETPAPETPAQETPMPPTVTAPADPVPQPPVQTTAATNGELPTGIAMLQRITRAQADNVMSKDDITAILTACGVDTGIPGILKADPAILNNVAEAFTNAGI